MGKKIGSTQRIDLLRNSVVSKLMPDTYTIRRKVTTGYTEYGTPIQEFENMHYNGSTDIPCRLEELKTFRELYQNDGADINVNLYTLHIPVDAPMFIDTTITVNGHGVFEVQKINEGGNWFGGVVCTISKLDRPVEV